MFRLLDIQPLDSTANEKNGVKPVLRWFRPTPGVRFICKINIALHNLIKCNRTLFVDVVKILQLISIKTPKANFINELISSIYSTCEVISIYMYKEYCPFLSKFVCLYIMTSHLQFNYDLDGILGIWFSKHVGSH